MKLFAAAGAALTGLYFALPSGSPAGIGIYPGDASSTDELIDVADRAMYRHKRPKRLALVSDVAS